MIQERNNIRYLDIITILSFVIGVYALDIALENLDENRKQNDDLKEVLNYLENHLQDQDLHLANQDELLKKITR